MIGYFLYNQRRRRGRRIVIASAPGKVILFGEHAVVLGKTAVATSLQLRTYTEVASREDGFVGLDMPDMNKQCSWALAAFVDLRKHPFLTRVNGSTC